MGTLNLNYNVDVIVSLSKMSVLRKAFDLMLIVGTSKIIDSVERVRLYYSMSEMDTDGWVGTEPEYVAAALAFSQSTPPQRVLIGRQSNLAGEVSSYALNAGGTGYSVGDVLTLVQSGATGGTFTVTSVVEGAVTAIARTAGGAGYTVATELATTVAPSGGTGCKIDVTAVSVVETAVEAANACRVINSEWCVLTICGIKSDLTTIQALAAWAESATPDTIFCFNTDDANVPTNSTSDIFSIIEALNYTRTMGQYSTYAAQPNCIVGIVAYAMGQMVGTLANSAYTLNFKTIVGLGTENITSSQFAYIVGKHGNVYVNRGEYYDWYQNGTMLDGSYFDERINLDKLSNDIQLGIADLYNTTNKVPQTEEGLTSLISAIVPACEIHVKTGFISPGKWLGATILNLAYGDTLPNGYLIQAESIADQTQADRDARKSPPIYVCVKESGAIHSLVIKVNVNR